jgi:phenylacetate-CoA ligase
MSPLREPAVLGRSQLGWALWLALNLPGQGRFPFRPPAVIERHQRRRLAGTVAHAYRHVPYYRETMSRLGLAPDDFATAADLARLPMLERSDLQRDPERFLSDAQPIESYVPLQTGGSSAEPLTVYHDRLALVQRVACDQRAGSLHRRVVGRRLGCRTLMIGHAPAAARGPLRRLFARLRKLKGSEIRRASILHPVERNVEAINGFRPHIVISHGSYLEELFLHLHATGAPLSKPRLVVYGSDAMSRRARALIGESFGIPVLSVYGSYEAPAMGFECPQGIGFHLNVDLQPVRIADGSGRELPDGESGEVVVSNLVNRGTIVLNYRLGDVARKVPVRCPCGRTLPLLSYRGERSGDWLLMPSGKRLHPATVAEVMEIDSGISRDRRDIFRYQVVQRSRSRLSVSIVARSDGDRDAIRSRTLRGFAELLEEGVAVEVTFVDALPRTPRGKVRKVVGLAGSGLHPAGEPS